MERDPALLLGVRRARRSKPRAVTIFPAPAGRLHQPQPICLGSASATKQQGTHRHDLPPPAYVCFFSFF